MFHAPYVHQCHNLIDCLEGMNKPHRLHSHASLPLQRTSLILSTQSYIQPSAFALSFYGLTLAPFTQVSL